MDGRCRGYPLALGAALLAVCVPLACSDPGASLARGVTQSAGNLRVGPAYEMSRVAFVLVDTGEGVNMTVEEATSFLQGPAFAAGGLVPARLRPRELLRDADVGPQERPLRPDRRTCNMSGLPRNCAGWSTRWEVARSFFTSGFRPAHRGLRMVTNGRDRKTSQRPATTADQRRSAVRGFAAYGWNVGMQVSGLMRCGGSVLRDPNVECTEVHAGDRSTRWVQDAGTRTPGRRPTPAGCLAVTASGFRAAGRSRSYPWSFPAMVCSYFRSRWPSRDRFSRARRRRSTRH